MIHRRNARMPDDPRNGRMVFYFERRLDGQAHRLLTVRQFYRRPA